jgi:hydroxymethylpyrimidine/phosphomethylpyrimidine kinase
VSVIALTIAGSDPSGGAGIQADLKTFSALGAYGTTVLTAVTAQNTGGVRGVHPLPVDCVLAQLEAVLDDVRVDAAKTGMLGDPELVEALVEALTRRPLPVLIVDPVMVAGTGQRLVDASAMTTIRERLLPLADLLTPNLAEAAALLDREPARSPIEMAEQGRALLDLGSKAVLVKGGHLDGTTAVDVLVQRSGVHQAMAPRVDTRNTHGTGCTLSAALTALRPRYDGQEWAVAVDAAKAYLTEAIGHGAALGVGTAAGEGRGYGPVHHFHAWWEPGNGLTDPPRAADPAGGDRRGETGAGEAGTGEDRATGRPGEKTTGAAQIFQENIGEPRKA